MVFSTHHRLIDNFVNAHFMHVHCTSNNIVIWVTVCRCHTDMVSLSRQYDLRSHAHSNRSEKSPHKFQIDENLPFAQLLKVERKRRFPSNNFFFYCDDDFGSMFVIITKWFFWFFDTKMLQFHIFIGAKLSDFELFSFIKQTLLF